MGKLFDLVDRLWDLLVLNFLWFIYILRGFIIFGFFPSTTAVYGVVRYWITNTDHENFSTLFKKYYKENFKNSNLLGWLLTVLSLMVFLNWYLVPSLNDPVIKTVIYGIIIPFSIFLILMWIYLFPVLVHFSFPWIQYLMIILKISITSLSYTILQTLIIIIYGILLANFTIFMAIFGLTILALGQMYICTYVFERIYSNKNLQV